jgi:hypothetical protein
MTSPWRSHRLKLALFGVLSLLDLGMTWLLLENSEGRIYEGNPIAGWWLATLGWAGLAAYKLGLVLVVGAAMLVVARRQPNTAGRFLTLACLIVGGVLVHSWSLTAAAAELSDGPSLGWEEQRASRFERVAERNRAYHVLLARLGEEVTAGRRMLHEAIMELAESDKGRNIQWQEQLQRTYPGRSVAECLAISFSRYVIVGVLRAGPDETRRVSVRLQAEYEALFGSQSPWVGSEQAW